MKFLALIRTLLAGCLILALAGCGGDETSVVSESTARTVAAESRQAPATKRLASGIRVTKGVGRANPLFEVEGTLTPPKLTVPPGPPPRNLVVKVLKQGVGNMRAKWGQRLTVHFVGVNYETKDQFEARWGKDDSFSFTFGSGEVRDGWETGLKGMKLGGQRELALPSRLAYDTGALLYVVELIAIEPLPDSPFAS